MTARVPLDPGDLADCASEQLHLSGRIQGHGALVAADLHDRCITYASANCSEIIGVATDQLFEKSVMSIFSSDDHQRLEAAFEKSGYRSSSPDLYGMRLAGPSEASVDVILHRAGEQIVIEVEPAHTDHQADRDELLHASETIATAASVPEIEATVVRTLRAMTGFDRAMVYRFHDDDHGEIVAEDCLPGLVRYLGHHFPASDIPPQARTIYTRKTTRYIPDVDEGDVPVVASPRMAGLPLDLSHAALRSVSPFHLEYMRNMNTAASVSFAIVVNGRLTRMVSCTSETPRSLARSWRRSCELTVLQAKLQLAAAEEISTLNESALRESIRLRLKAAMHSAPEIAIGLTTASDDLLELCRAHGAAACIDGQYQSVGAAGPEDAVRRYAREISSDNSPHAPWASDRLPRSSADTLGVAGCLFVPLSAPNDFLVWFRRDRPQQLRWLGDPRAHEDRLISPRKSFATWLEDVSGSSAPWTQADLEAARLLANDVESAQLTRAREAQHERDATSEAIYVNAPIGIALVGLDGTFKRVNQALCRITGYSEYELTQLTFQDITHPDDLDIDVGDAARLLHGEIPSYQMDKRYYAKDGHVVWVHLSASIVRDADGRPLHFISHIEDISARRRDEELLRRRATRDALTGVYNRARFDEELARYTALARRSGADEEAAVFMIDLDGLKKINDRDGHAAGDDYIKSVAHTISRRLRLSDVFARIGGDEFAVLLPRTSPTQARELAHMLVELVRANSPGNISIGIAMVTPELLDDALQRADRAMYQAKRLGGGRSYGP